jgi:hypothetical protein
VESREIRVGKAIGFHSERFDVLLFAMGWVVEKLSTLVDVLDLPRDTKVDLTLVA